MHGRNAYVCVRVRTCVRVCVWMCGCALVLRLPQIEGRGGGGEGGGMRGEGNCIGIRYTDSNCLDLISVHFLLAWICSE